MFATLATLCEDPGVSEPECCYASRVIHPYSLLRVSEDDSGTGLHVLDLIDRGSLKPDRYLYNQLLRRCTETGKLREGRIVHAHISKSPFGCDVVITNTIVNMYVQCGSLDDAREVFDEMPVKDLVTWTMLITGYSRSSRPEEALDLLPQMLRLGLDPNQYALSSLIKASYSSTRELHAYCLKRGYDGDPHVGSSLVDMYARLGSIDEALLIFDGLAETRTEASWNSLIAAYARRGEVGTVLGIFWQMRGEGILPTAHTYSSLCTAFAGAGCLEQGRWVHAHVIKLARGGIVSRSLLEMYARSGGVEDAQKIFERLKTGRDLGCWNALLDGYARRGLGKEAATKFREMLRFGIRPDESTFLSLLTACSHSGLLDQGQRFFKLMKMKYGIEPGIRHYTAMVDLLGRAGLVERAERFIHEMPVKPTADVWRALLCACRTHKRTELEARAAEWVFALDPQDRGPHTFLYEMYASAGKLDEASRARKMMESEKELACSWVEFRNSVHVFIASDECHLQMEEIRRVLERLRGYVPETSHVHLFVGRRGEETDLQGHSEKLALAFALLNAPPGSNIQVKKKR